MKAFSSSLIPPAFVELNWALALVFITAITNNKDKHHNNICITRPKNNLFNFNLWFLSKKKEEKTQKRIVISLHLAWRTNVRERCLIKVTIVPENSARQIAIYRQRESLVTWRCSLMHIMSLDKIPELGDSVADCTQYCQWKDMKSSPSNSSECRCTENFLISWVNWQDIIISPATTMKRFAKILSSTCLSLSHVPVMLWPPST